MRNIVTRMALSLKQFGLYGTYLKVHAILSDPLFDIKYGTDTGKIIDLKNLTIKSPNIKYGIRYQPTKVIYLRKFLQQIKAIIPAKPVLVDFGCGKGRVLLIASEYGFNELRGIEFSHELCEIAKINIDIFRSRNKTDAVFRIIESDVTKYSVQSDENVFFMFNPFSETVMEQALNNISTSLKEWPRKILIIYVNPIEDKFIDSFDGIRKVRKYLYGYPFVVYTNYFVE